MVKFSFTEMFGGYKQTKYTWFIFTLHTIYTEYLPLHAFIYLHKLQNRCDIVQLTADEEMLIIYM